MPKIAGTYDYQDPHDPPDAFARFERADYEQRDKSGRSAERGKPFTAKEIEYFEFRQGITQCKTPVQPEPQPGALTKVQKARVLTFDPLAGVDDAIAVCREHIDLIKATSRRDFRKVARIRAAIKGTLDGAIFAEVAAELKQDPAVVSKAMEETYAKWPKLEPAITILNLLTNMAKRRELPTQWQFTLRMGEQIFDDGVLIWGEWPNSGPRNHVADPDHIVKLAELQYKAFPPIRSNFGAAVAAISYVTPKGDVTWEGAPSRGSQRLERVRYDKWDYETERTDGSVRIGAFKDRDRLHDGIDAWQRLREFLGLSPTCRWLACHDVLFDMFGLEFFRAEIRLRKANRPEHPAGLPASFLDAPWINPGYLIPTGPADTPLVCKAPYVPFVNECPPAQKRKLRLGKYPAKVNRFKGKTLRTMRWASELHNATNYGPDANKQFLKIHGVAEPKRAWRSADVSVRPMVHDGTKWKRGRHGTRCMPRNSSLPKFREDELITGWPILAPSMHQDIAVLFAHQVTAG